LKLEAHLPSGRHDDDDDDDDATPILEYTALANHRHWQRGSLIPASG